MLLIVVILSLIIVLIGELWNELRTVQISIGEPKDKKLIRVRDRRRIVRGDHKIVVVPHPEGVNGLTVLVNIFAERHAFDLGRNIERRAQLIRREHTHDVQEERLGNCILDGSRSVEPGYIDRALQANFEDLFHLGRIAGQVIAAFASLAVAFVD